MDPAEIENTEIAFLCSCDTMRARVLFVTQFIGKTGFSDVLERLFYLMAVEETLTYFFAYLSRFGDVADATAVLHIAKDLLPPSLLEMLLSSTLNECMASECETAVRFSSKQPLIQGYVDALPSIGPRFFGLACFMPEEFWCMLSNKEPLVVRPVFDLPYARVTHGLIERRNATLLRVCMRADNHDPCVTEYMEDGEPTTNVMRNLSRCVRQDDMRDIFLDCLRDREGGEPGWRFMAKASAVCDAMLAGAHIDPGQYLAAAAHMMLCRAIRGDAVTSRDIDALAITCSRTQTFAVVSALVVLTAKEDNGAREICKHIVRKWPLVDVAMLSDALRETHGSIVSDANTPGHET